MLFKHNTSCDISIRHSNANTLIIDVVIGIIKSGGA